MNDITVTTTLPFGLCDSEQQPFFSVNAGISLEDALAHLSHLLKCAHASAFELCDTPNPDRGLVWSALHHIDGAKGLVDALLAGYESGR